MSPNPEMAKLHAAIAAPLDDKLYHLDPDEVAFYKQKTGIDDEAALKEHIVQIQREAYQVFPYICIRWFSFTKVKIARHPAYNQLLKLGKERNSALFIDVGCCFGNDIRKAVADGFPAKNCIGTDLEGAFWHLGYRLFKDTPESFPVPFLQGDILNPSFLDPSPLLARVERPHPDLTSLTTLTPLVGQLTAIHASMLFHLFPEQQQLKLAGALAALLAPTPGAMIFGWHVGDTEKGFIKGATLPNGEPLPMFCHSAESWKEMWDGEVFEKGTVEVKAELQKLEAPPGVVPNGAQFWQLIWSVTRL
ncbi:hypothetical protein DAEQUDRAFT_813157 [Daedalea quercina L-15889]|uniref:Methyltransferase domain-containing protein n=1 Tax=Daedalea quercina L-15889 TaxID=1314783 RepID=A0A165NIJ6_9APHY|nr:hypothetical protein DAEQUDRAFT_813157 [Daedalea quercina L-15889]